MKKEILEFVRFTVFTSLASIVVVLVLSPAIAFGGLPWPEDDNFTSWTGFFQGVFKSFVIVNSLSLVRSYMESCYNKFIQQMKNERSTEMFKEGKIREAITLHM